jgi:drug/metabolite transporter (DMT)-like permease
MVVVAVLVLAVLAPSVCARVAFRRREAQWPTVVAFTLQFVGVVALGLGLLAWIVDGYTEDDGSRPIESLQVAVPLLIVAVAATAVAWFLALRPRGPR